jgi:hypothetical protein
MKYGHVPRVSRMNGRARDTNEGNRRHFTMSFLKSSVSLVAGSRASKSPPRGLGQHRVILICSRRGSRLSNRKAQPGAARYLHPSIGSKEFINGLDRWILALDGASPSSLRSMPGVTERIASVREFRLRSESAPTQELANSPTRYHVTVIPDRPFLVVPESSSERRKHVPIAWLSPPIIPSSLVRVLLDADLWHFGVLTSSMHMVRLRQIGGRLKSDYRYSVGIVYNTFPWPEATDRQTERVRALAQQVLDARQEFPTATLADLYDADTMPPRLRRGHGALDDAVDKLYRSAGFSGDRD